MYENRVLIPAVKGVTGTEKNRNNVLPISPPIISLIQTRTRWTGHVARTFKMAATIMMLIEFHTNLRSLHLKATAYLGILILNEDISDVTAGWYNVKWVNMVREDVTGCDNSKEPSDFVKGEKFIEWFSDCSLLTLVLGVHVKCLPICRQNLFSMPLGGHHGQLVLQISYCLQLQNCSGSRGGGGGGKYNNNNNNNKAFGNQLSHSRYKTRGLLYRAKQPAQNFVTLY